MIQEVNFPVDVAASYIKQQLSSGGILAKILLEILSLDNGNVSTYLPEEVPLDKQVEFEYGGIFPDIKARQKLAHFIFQFIKNHKENYVIFEELLATVEDRWDLENTNDRYLTHKNGIYYLLKEDEDLKDIIRILEVSSKYPSIGILTSHKIQFTNGQSISTDILRELAQNTQHILIDAYDGESYIIWTRKGLI